MIRAEQIPDEVVEAAAKTLMAPDYPNSWPAWMDEARAALAAALNAWPGAHTWDTGQVWHHPAIVLPLPQGAAAPLEPRDE